MANLPATAFMFVPAIRTTVPVVSATATIPVLAVLTMNTTMSGQTLPAIPEATPGMATIPVRQIKNQFNKFQISKF
jgi:hypothetical protein